MYRRTGRYLSYKEAQALSPVEYKTKYPGAYLIMWDTTDRPLDGEPSDRWLRYVTYSDYYGGCVMKGGVGLQQGVWLVPGELWTGGVSDTDFLVVAGILDEQAVVAARQSDAPPMTNICDKGMRCEHEAWARGRQLLVTPTFRRRDSPSFAPGEVAHSTSLAHDRGPNERAVRLACLDGINRQPIPSSMALDDANMFWMNGCSDANWTRAPLWRSLLAMWAQL